MCEIISHHWNLFFNPTYGRFGRLTLPYIFIFEFIAPILEAIGLGFMIWLVLASKVNWTTAFVIFGMVYVFALVVTAVTIILDYTSRAVKWKHSVWSYLKLLIAGATEPFLYHPIITFCTLFGYVNFLTHRKAEWKQIQRRGFNTSTNSDQQTDSKEQQQATAR